MAKVRVYELAKELDMESKKLVEKLKAGGMKVKNYMSTLDEQAVVRAKEIVSGAVSEVVEEKRIKPTVIRRRRKVIRVEQKPPETVPEEETGPEPTPETEQAPPEAVSEEKPDVAEEPPEEVLPPQVEKEVEQAPAKEPEPEPEPPSPEVLEEEKEIS